MTSTDVRGRKILSLLAKVSVSDLSALRRRYQRTRFTLRTYLADGLKYIKMRDYDSV